MLEGPVIRPNSLALSTGAALRRCRLNAGMSQEELANRAELSVRAIANIEAGRVRRPHPHSLRKLADALGMSGQERDVFVRPPAPQPSKHVADGPAQSSAVVDPDPPGPATLRTPVRQLPTDIGDFVGRHDECRSISSFLCPDTAVRPPVAVITGQGGIGKTALALRVAHSAAEAFPDGQLFVDLGGSSRPQEPAAVLGRMLRALGVEARSFAAADVEERACLFRSIVAELRLLIVLDNAADEHQVRSLLPGRGASATLLTSRNHLAALEAARGFVLGLFALDEARTLLDRIVSVRRTRAEPTATDSIIRSCGGLPLAVRIAGARLAARPGASITSVARQLHDRRQRLDRLKVGDLEVRTTIGLGYEALPEGDRRALRNLTIVDLPTFSAWALAPLLGNASSEASVVADRLAGHRLLEIVGTDPKGEPRYRLHDLVRLFASEQSLREDTEQDRHLVLERALGLWLVVAETITQGLPSTPWTSTAADGIRWNEDVECVRQLRESPRPWFLAERRNLSAAVRACLAHGLSAQAWQIAGAMTSPCILYSDYDLLREVAARTRDACRDAGDAQGTAAMTNSLAGVETQLCEWAIARTLAEEAYELFAEVDDLPGQASAATCAADSTRMSFQYDNECDVEEVMIWSSRAAALCEKLDDPNRRADVTYVLGKMLLAIGDVERAREQFEEFLRLAIALEKPVSQAHALSGLGRVAHLAGQPIRAATAYRRALKITEEVGDRQGVGHVGLALAEVLAESGDRSAAVALAHRALSIFQALHITRKIELAQELLLRLSLRSN